MDDEISPKRWILNEDRPPSSRDRNESEGEVSGGRVDLLVNEVTTDLSEKFGRKSINHVLEPSRVPVDVFGKGDLVLEGGGGGEREWRKEERANRRRELLEDFEEASLPLEMSKKLRLVTESSSTCASRTIYSLWQSDSGRQRSSHQRTAQGREVGRERQLE